MQDDATVSDPQACIQGLKDAVVLPVHSREPHEYVGCSWRYEEKQSVG
jgi:hypothetical protein